ncbi:MAG: DUF2117 domain-containing protein [Candidatus Bathyarchaeota archaeon]|nr:DUF2117 domain-containing protein [Candidatus Bathyarchaeota archaeon]
MPEIFDSGWADKILKALKDKNFEVLALTYGTMGRTALIDNFMEDKVRYEERKPTEFLPEISSRVDAVIIATHTFSPKKSHANCWHLIRNLNLENVVEVETNSGVVVAWSSKLGKLAKLLSESLGLRLTEPPKLPTQTIWIKNGKKFRRILGVDVGDYVMVNKIVVGEAVSEDVVIVEKNGFITDVLGVNLKKNSLNKLNKLGKVDVEKVSVDTRRNLRFTYKTPRLINMQETRKGVFFLNHDAYKIYNFVHKAEGVVVIGDDTTMIAMDILYRFQVPALGVVDADPDKLLENIVIPKNSAIITVKDDDTAGEKIYEEIFGGKDVILKNFNHVKDEIIKKLSSLDLLLSVKEF